MSLEATACSVIQMRQVLELKAFCHLRPDGVRTVRLVRRFDIHRGLPLLTALGNDLCSPEGDSRAGPEVGRNRGDRCWKGLTCTRTAGARLRVSAGHRAPCFAEADQETTSLAISLVLLWVSISKVPFIFAVNFTDAGLPGDSSSSLL